jgi:hypothetical protein
VITWDKNPNVPLALVVSENFNIDGSVRGMIPVDVRSIDSFQSHAGRIKLVEFICK